MSEGGGYEGVSVREFWPHWIWGVCSLGNSSHHVLQYCFCSCFWFSVYPCILVETLYNCSIWPPFDATHTYEKICLCFFKSALFSLLRCSSRYSSFLCPYYTHDFQRMQWMCSQRGKKQSVPSKIQTNCPLWGISQNSHVKWDAWEGGGMEKWGTGLLILKGKKTKQDGPKGFP